MWNFGKKRKIHVTTTLSEELKTRAEKAGIKFNYALAVGVRQLLGDEVSAETPYNELKEKVAKLTARLSETTQRIYELEKK